MTILVAFHSYHYRTLVSRYNGSQTRNALTRNFKHFYPDRGYVSQPLAKKLLEEFWFGIQFFAKPRRNMRSRHSRVSRPCAIDASGSFLI